METGTLLYHYQYMAATQGLGGLTGKFSMACGLLAVLAGQRNAGMRLLYFVLAGHFLLSAYLAIMDTGAQTAVLALICAALGAAVLHSCYKEPADWVILPEDAGPRLAAGAVYLLAFAWPFWALPGGAVSRVVYSLMAPLPHQTLLVLLAMIAVEGTRTPKFLGYTAIAAAGLLAALDATLAARQTTLIVGAAGLVAAGSMLRDKFGWSPFVASPESEREEKVTADRSNDPPTTSRFARPSPPRPAAQQQAAPAAKKAPEEKADSGKRKWDLK